MSATRLLVLGVVRMHGRAHGYRVGRELMSWGADAWVVFQRQTRPLLRRPVMILFGMLQPVLYLAPGWLYALSRVNPIAYVVDAERALFAGEWGATAGVGWAVALGLAVVALAIGARATRWSAR
ncbi:hypothetical protein BJF83_10045 [Nocardiopsis sp. CNR-923]|nr:hypothetical protein BJF83_10045 [Nocardiopsis sp. CNR-923]